MSGFGKLWIVAKNVITGLSDPLGGVLRKSIMSFPAVKADPAPVITTVRIPKSPEAETKVELSEEYIAGVRAFFFSGRSRVITSVCSICSIAIWVISLV
jgi:hypothetical protein